MAASNISTWPTLDAAGLTAGDKIAVHTSGALHAATTMDDLANYNAAFGRYYGIDVVRNNAAGSVLASTGSPTQLTYDTTVTDTTGAWDGSAVWACPRTGYWFVVARILISQLSMSGGNTDFLLTLGLYDDDGLVESTGRPLNSRNLDVADLGATISVSTIIALVEGHAITVGIMQDSGNDLTMSADYSRFKVASLGAV